MVGTWQVAWDASNEEAGVSEHMVVHEVSALPGYTSNQQWEYREEGNGAGKHKPQELGCRTKIK